MIYFHIPTDIERDKDGNPIKPNPLFIYQNKPMTIQQYLESKEIKPEELSQHFNFIKRFNMDVSGFNGCFNCGDHINVENIRTGAWTNGQWCHKCDCINIAYIQDRMGGIYTDVIDVFQEKQLP